MSTDTTIGVYEIDQVTDLDYLIGSLRAHIGDITSPFTYSDGFLRRLLVDAIKGLYDRWNKRYTIDSNYIVSRTGNWTYFDSAPPTIQIADELPIILAASITLRSGILNISWNSIGSWRDDEISSSNIQGGSLLANSLQRDIDLLNSLLPNRNKKLAAVKKQSLPGFSLDVGNQFEG